MPLFGKSQKSPAELVKALKEAVNSLERGDKKAEKAQEDVSKNLVSKVAVIYFTFRLVVVFISYDEDDEDSWQKNERTTTEDEFVNVVF